MDSDYYKGLDYCTDLDLDCSVGLDSDCYRDFEWRHPDSFEPNCHSSYWHWGILYFDSEECSADCYNLDR